MTSVEEGKAARRVELVGQALISPAASPYIRIRQHTSAYVSMRQHTSKYVSIRQHTSAYVSIRQHTSEERVGEGVTRADGYLIINSMSYHQG